MGIGLAAARDLVTELGGSITVDSTSAQGSTFRVVLPSRNLPALEPHAQSRSAVTSPSAHPRRKRPRVLVIDDEALLCQLLAESLAAEYEVETFSTPQAGLDTLLRERFDVVLCDLMMPEITGMQIYEQLAESRPELARSIIFITGGAFTEDARRFLATTRRPQIRKPFTHEELVDAIEDLLAASIA
jgi:CheY-like chemotaxis protein